MYGLWAYLNSPWIDDAFKFLSYPVYVFCVCSKFILIMNTTELSQRLHICFFLITLYLFVFSYSYYIVVLGFSGFVILHIHTCTYTHIYTHIHLYTHIHTYIYQTHPYSHLCTYTMCIDSIHRINNTCK